LGGGKKKGANLCWGNTKGGGGNFAGFWGKKVAFWAGDPKIISYPGLKNLLKTPGRCHLWGRFVDHFSFLPERGPFQKGGGVGGGGGGGLGGALGMDRARKKHQPMR